MLKKILLVEDEADLIEVLKMRLESSGYEFISAMDGSQGIKKALEEKPDLILLDVIMPNMDGFEVCKRLKADSQTKNIPIILLTAAGLKDIEDKARACGADLSARKPYDSADLLVKIKALLK